jgi:hypothetical protein
MDLTVECKLLEFGEGKVAKEVMPLHELSLVISGAEVDLLILLQLGVEIEGEWPHSCCLHCCFAFIF